MSNYKLKYTPEALFGVENFKRAGDKSILKKLDKLLEELIEHPRSGTGHPEQLKGYPNKERWSRHITKKHRLVYDIEEEVIVVLIISVYGHYDDD